MVRVVGEPKTGVDHKITPDKTTLDSSERIAVSERQAARRRYEEDAYEPAKQSRSETRVWHFYLGGMEVYRIHQENFELRVNRKGKISTYPFIGNQNATGEIIAHKWLKKPPSSFGLKAPCTFSNKPLAKRSPAETQN